MKNYSSLDGNILKIAEFIRSRGCVPTHDIIAYAIEKNLPTNRADRDARKLREYGFIERMSEEEKLRRYGKIGQGIWKWVSDYSNDVEFSVREVGKQLVFV